MHRFLRLFAATSPLLAALLIGSARSEEARTSEVRLAASRTLLRGGDPAAAEAALKLISRLVHSQTGVPVECVAFQDGTALAKGMNSGNAAMGLLPGIELAWMNKKNAGLRPMLLACNENISLKALVVVRADAALPSVTSLKGKRLSFPKMNFNHTFLFLDKAIRDAGYQPAHFFASCTAAANPDAALEAVLEGDADVAVVDEVAMEVYRGRKPGRAKRLRVLQESSKFPCAVIVCKPEMAKSEEVKKIQQGLSTAHERPAGRQMLSLMRLSAFVPVTAEYEQLLKDVLKDYPEPVEPVDFTRLTPPVETTQQR
jgi:ABC-type phosphate/phosphonate transport system substrate-binding protein